MYAQINPILELFNFWVYLVTPLVTGGHVTKGSELEFKSLLIEQKR